MWLIRKLSDALPVWVCRSIRLYIYPVTHAGTGVCDLAWPCVFVRVRALEEKRVELSTPNLVGMYSI